MKDIENFREFRVFKFRFFETNFGGFTVIFQAYR